MNFQSKIKKIWSESNKSLKYSIFLLIGFTIYTMLILSLLPRRYYRSGYYLPGLSGWEFGLLFIIIYVFITLILFESPDWSSDGVNQPERLNLTYKNLVILNIFIFLAIFLLLFATQLLENLIAVYKCQSRTGEKCNKDTSGWMLFYNMFASMGIEHNDVLYLIWTFSGVFFIGCFLFFGAGVDYAKRKGVFQPNGWNAFNYIFWVNVILGSTGWMYIAWFSLTDFDIKMWIALLKGETWGYFSIGIVGVFFNSVPELIFMIGVSCSLFFLNFYTLKKYYNKICENK